MLSELGGATLPPTFILVDDTPHISEAKFYLANPYTSFLSSSKSAPFEVAISVGPGAHRIQVREETSSGSTRKDYRFVTVKARPSTGGASSPITAPVKAPSIPIPAATVTVSSAAQLTTALRSAKPGDVIHLKDGVYTNDNGDRWHLAKSGTAAAPITLEGGRGAVLQSDSTSGDYGMWITGSYWHVLGLSVRNASKGIVLDHSLHTVIDDVEVSDVGDEGVHFRTCSSDDVLQNSFVHDTGLRAPNFGEASYVGSANSNWSRYGCVDGQDKSEHDVIRGNIFQHIPAEGSDLKEGTDSGTLTGNLYIDTGFSGQNSADSAVDVKGNGWSITDNVVRDPSGSDTDGFQTHSVYPGYGTANVFSHNAVVGAWPGFGIGMYPGQANIVFCNNQARDAAGGLVGNDGHKVDCDQ